MPSSTVEPLHGPDHPFKTGAHPTPRHKLLATHPFRQSNAPAQAAFVPKKLSYWLNDQYGDCVTAEEAFKCACDNPEDFVADSVVQTWASANGVLNGADLTQVMDAMQKNGFLQSPNTYNDGPYQGVDYSNEAVLQAAIATGPVKVGLDSSALPSGAGNGQGWYATGGTPGQFSNEDHCCALCGYGTAQWLYQQLGVALPSALQPTQMGYLFFTWSTIGFVDHAWIMSTVGEAWIRTPSTVIVGPEPQPIPPGPGPAPPTPPAMATLAVATPLTAGVYQLPGGVLLTLSGPLTTGSYPVALPTPIPPDPPVPPIPPVPPSNATLIDAQAAVVAAQKVLADLQTSK